MTRRTKRIVIIASLIGSLFLAVLLGGGSDKEMQMRLLEVRWTNDQPYLILETRYPPFTGLMPRFSMMQREKLMVWRNGQWQFEGTPYDPAKTPIVEQIYPNRSEPLNLNIARYSVRVPYAEMWRLELDSFETRLLGYPLFRKPLSRDFSWKSPELPGVAKMLELNLTNSAAVLDFLRADRSPLP